MPGAIHRALCCSNLNSRQSGRSSNRSELALCPQTVSAIASRFCSCSEWPQSRLPLQHQTDGLDVGSGPGATYPAGHHSLLLLLCRKSASIPLCRILVHIAWLQRIDDKPLRDRPSTGCRCSNDGHRVWQAAGTPSLAGTASSSCADDAYERWPLLACGPQATLRPTIYVMA